MEGRRTVRVTTVAEYAADHDVIHKMGHDPKTSFVNRWQQAHEVPNLFLMDGSVYPSSACQNPTITIMALAARACDHLVEEWKRGNV